MDSELGNNNVSEFYINKLNQLEENPDLDPDDITNIVTEIQDVYPQVSDTINLKLDAQLLYGLTQALERYIVNNPFVENDNQKYDPKLWVESLMSEYKIVQPVTESLFWDEIGSVIGDKHFNVALPFRYMYGTAVCNKFMANPQLDTISMESSANNAPSTSQTIPKPKSGTNYKGDRDKAGKAPTRPELGVEKDPFANSDADPSVVNQNAVDAIFDHLIHVWELNSRKPVSFWSLVFDLESFENTVLNIFHASFLLKDGYVQVYYSTEAGGHPLVYPIPRTVLKSRTSGNKDHIFTFLEITREQWECLKSVVKPFEKRMV